MKYVEKEMKNQSIDTDQSGFIKQVVDWYGRNDTKPKIWIEIFDWLWCVWFRDCGSAGKQQTINNGEWFLFVRREKNERDEKEKYVYYENHLEKIKEKKKCRWCS